MKKRFNRRKTIKTVVSIISAAVLTVSSLPYVFSASPNIDTSMTYETLMAHASTLIGLDRSGENTISSEYTGSGMVIAVIDSAFDTSHPIFALSDGAETKITQDFINMKKDTLYSSKYYEAAKYDGVYISEKIPYAYDYAELDNVVISPESHGTHVAAVAAGNSANGGQFDGVVPDAQLLLMKVFYDNGDFGGDIMIADAVVDAISLGADVINLSLGTSAGSADYFGMPHLKYALEEAVNSGIVIVCASGNSGLAGSGSTYDLDYAITNPQTSYTDYGLVSEPSTMRQAISVAAAHNEVLYKKFVYSGTGEEISYSDPSSVQSVTSENSFYSAFSGKTLGIVFVGGLGEESDYKALADGGVSLKGKIAVVSRGTITFVDKITNAYNAGASGIIIYNNVPDDDITMQTGDVQIPAVSVSYEDGQKLLNLSEDKKYIKIPDVPYVVAEDDEKSLVASFSSWGTTPELLIKPEITAIGNNVFSAVNNSDYESMDGTSMASPMIAGASAMILQKLKADDTQLEGAELVAEVKSILMNTAKVIEGDNGAAKSPRQQGAGILDISAALSSDTFIFYEKELSETSFSIEAKTELGDNLQSTYTFPVTVYNSSGEEKEYKLSGSIQSDGYTTELIGVSSKYFSDPDNPEAFEKSSFTVDEDETKTNLNRYSENSGEYTFTLSSGEKKTFNISINIDKSEFDQYNKIFTYGWFTEGFVYVTDISGEFEVSIPYMGYIGSWDDSPIFDLISYDGNESVYPGQYVYTDIGDILYYLGTNLFTENIENRDFKSELISFSPNKDYTADDLYFYIAPLRNMIYYDIEIISESGELVYFYYGDYVTKAMNIEGQVGYLMYLWDGTDGINPRFILPDGKYTCNIIGYNESGGTQTLAIPLVLDTEKPTVDSYEIREENGKMYLDITASDSGYIQYALVYLPKSGQTDESDNNANDGNDEKYLFKESYIPKYRKNSTTITYSFDISDVKGDYVYLELTDYAVNTTLVRINIK